MTKHGVGLVHLILNGWKTEVTPAPATCQHAVCVHTSHAPTASLLPWVNTTSQVVKSKLWNKDQANAFLYNISLDATTQVSFKLGAFSSKSLSSVHNSLRDRYVAEEMFG